MKSEIERQQQPVELAKKIANHDLWRYIRHGGIDDRQFGLEALFSSSGKLQFQQSPETPPTQTYTFRSITDAPSLIGIRNRIAKCDGEKGRQT